MKFILLTTTATIALSLFAATPTAANNEAAESMSHSHGIRGPNLLHADKDAPIVIADDVAVTSDATATGHANLRTAQDDDCSVYNGDPSACSSDDHYCSISDDDSCGKTNSYAYGKCAMMPTMCSTITNAVCGCDGRTYENKCKANSFGVNVRSDGSCGGINGKTLVDPGGVCQEVDYVCSSGYDCINGICQLNPIAPGDVCQVGIDVCESGYACVDGRCAVPPVPAGGTCQHGEYACVEGYSCVNSRCEANDAPAGTCTVNCNCYSNDCGVCTTNCNCFGTCELPVCTLNCNCNGGICSEAELGR